MKNTAQFHSRNHFLFAPFCYFNSKLLKISKITEMFTLYECLGELEVLSLFEQLTPLNIHYLYGFPVPQCVFLTILYKIVGYFLTPKAVAHI